MKKPSKMKTLTTALLMIGIMLLGTVTASAQTPTTPVANGKTQQIQITSEEYENLGSEMLVNTLEQDEELRKLGTDANPNAPMTRVVTSSGFVTGFSSAKMYNTIDFSQYQYNNNCTPTLAANILSYFHGSRGVNLNAGNITQSLYNQICADIGYSTSNGGNLNGIATGLKAWSSRYGKTCVVDKYWLNTWSDVTRDINANKPVMLGYSNHAYLILGYKVENGVQQLFVATGWQNSPYQYLTFANGMQMQSVNIY